MISAWGVDHGMVSKSFVPGKGYKAATELGRFERQKVKAYAESKKLHAGAKGMTRKDTKRKEFLQGAAEEMKSIRRRSVKIGEFKGVDMLATEMPEGMAAFVMRRGGTKSGRSQMYLPTADAVSELSNARKGNPSETFRHEMVHAKAKRSANRIIEMPQKGRGAEEARADFGAGVNYRKTPGSNGYTEMANSERARLLMRFASEKQQGSAPFVNGYRRQSDKLNGETRRAKRSVSTTPIVYGAAGAGAGVWALKGRQQRAKDGKFS